MRIAVTTAGTDLDSQVELRFGRATSFLVYDTDSSEFEIIDNRQQLNDAQGAGIRAAQIVVHSGADALISGHCGPKAFKVLGHEGVDVYISEKSTIADVLDALAANKLEKLYDADVEGYWVEE
jgi:predicted Fe-Mo cluster-binding NifX family protein